MTNKQRSILMLVGFIAVLPLLPLLFGRFPAIGDMRDVFIPLESFFRSQQLQASLPAWNPAVSFGFPVIASAQIGFFYPALFFLRFFPLPFELSLALAIHSVACAVGMFLYAKRIGISKEGSLLTAISFSLSQFIWQHLTHLNIFLAVAWFPWQMLAVHTIFTKKAYTKKDIVTLIALFGVPFLIGQIQIPFLIMLVSLFYGTYLSYQNSTLRKTIVPIIGIAVATFLFAAVQLLPTVELASLSSRGASGGFDVVRANQHSYPIYHLPTILFPRFYGNDNTYWGKRLEIEYGSYIGVIPFLLATWFLVSVIRSKKRNAEVTFFMWLTGISLLLALGSFSPFRLLGIEPSLWIFSAPSRWLLFTTFSFALFAGCGFDTIWQSKSKKLFTWIAGLSVALLIIGNILLFTLSTPSLSKLQSILASARTSSISLTSSYTYIFLFSILVLPYAVSHKKGKLIVLAVSLIDLVSIAATTTPTLPWKLILEVPVTVQQLPESVQAHMSRIYSLRDGGDTGAYFTNPSSRADATVRQLQKDLLVPMVSAQFGVYGIEWPASLDLTEQGMQLEKLHPTQSYAVENEVLADELTIGAVLSPASNGAIAIQSRSAKPRIEIKDGTINSVSETPSQLRIDLQANTDTTLIVRDTMYPGWHAYIDGREVPIQKEPLFFRSVSIPQGDHEIGIKYVPKMLYIGGAISLLTLLITSIMFRRK